MKIIKKIYKILINLIFILMICLSVFLVVTKISGNTPNLFGYYLYYIVSPSMEPSIEVGDIILSKEVDDYSTLKVGDVITYQGMEGSFNGKLVTHQIIEIEYENSEYKFYTQGTKEGAIVDPVVHESQVNTKMICKIPFLGKIITFLSSSFGFIFFIILPLLGCLIIEIFNFIKVFKEEKEDKE